MKQVGDGNTIRIHYTGRLDDGTIFDSSKEREPLEFTMGSGDIIKGFEDAVRGMTVGELKTIRITSGEAYGPYRDDLVMSINKSQLPPDIEAMQGAMLSLRHPDGRMIDAMIAEVTADSVTLDANHPLAGEDLTFELQLVAIA
jgi:peptidylprolyl isomerase